MSLSFCNWPKENSVESLFILDLLIYQGHKVIGKGGETIQRTIPVSGEEKYASHHQLTLPSFVTVLLTRVSTCVRASRARSQADDHKTRKGEKGWLARKVCIKQLSIIYISLFPMLRDVCLGLFGFLEEHGSGGGDSEGDTGEDGGQGAGSALAASAATSAATGASGRCGVAATSASASGHDLEVSRVGSSGAQDDLEGIVGDTVSLLWGNSPLGVALVLCAVDGGDIGDEESTVGVVRVDKVDLSGSWGGRGRVARYADPLPREDGLLTSLVGNAVTDGACEESVVGGAGGLGSNGSGNGGQDGERSSLEQHY
ncbi:hypothetical protein B0O80DRAFT_447417, partial [Mortierella sp. GBAus27b]